MSGKKIIDGLRDALAHARASGLAGGWGGTYTQEELDALRKDLAAMNAEARAARMARPTTPASEDGSGGTQGETKNG